MIFVYLFVCFTFVENLHISTCSNRNVFTFQKNNILILLSASQGFTHPPIGVHMTLSVGRINIWLTSKLCNYLSYLVHFLAFIYFLQFHLCLLCNYKWNCNLSFKTSVLLISDKLRQIMQNLGKLQNFLEKHLWRRSFLKYKKWKSCEDAHEEKSKF